MRYSGLILAGLLAAGGASAQQAPSLLYTQPLAPAAVTQVQERLRQAGNYAGRPDGVWGPDSQAALATFDGVVLTALEETETALARYARALERRTALQAARDQAAIAARITRAQQREGQIDSLAQLDAERTFADTEAALALAHAQIARAQIDVFRALGGQWRNA